MPTFPSSQSKSKHTVDLPHRIKAALARSKAAHLTLSMKVNKLRTLKSNDPVQQLQSDIISDMYDLVRELQVDLFPSLLGLPDVGSVRAGLDNGGGH